MSIIDEKYKGKYKGASDWIGRLIEEKCTMVPEGSKDGAKGELHLPDLMALARANGLNEDKLVALEAQWDTKNGPGRVRMTIGNMLRAAAKRRHGLVDIDGTKLKPDKEFAANHLVDKTPTETLEGEKIEAKEPKAPKPDKAADAPAKKAAAKAPAKKAAAKKK